jgi:hypothetical protein
MKSMQRPPLPTTPPAMRRALALAAWLTAAGMLAWLAAAWPLQAQAPTPSAQPPFGSAQPPLGTLTPRDALIQAIQERAQRDVAMGKTVASAGDLDLLFGEEAAAAGMSTREMVDTYETAYQAAQSPKSPLEDFVSPNIGWLVAVLLFVLLILRDVIQDWLAGLFKGLGEAIYRRAAGYRLFWMIALRRYRKALERAHEELKVPFRPGRPLHMQDVYVPLRATGGSSREAVDAYQAVQKHRWLVVVGAPGAGKSMLLRHLALTYARQGLRDFPDQPVPILLELNRLNNSTLPLAEHLTRVLEQNDFPGAGRFVEAALQRGDLLLLFDGLDEVISQERERVAGQVRDLLQRYPGTRAVATCRTQVYKDEFAGQADQKLEIAEFDDGQIQRFLSAWGPDMPKGKSIEQLLHTLRERPRIMALARNPLLLTMIAYLYTDTAFALPHSRAEFYDRSTALLLEQWKTERNRYKVSQKRLVLQHLALFNQARAGQAGGDRRSLDLPTVLAQIRGVLPSLTLGDGDAQPMLDEIVERSGLLLAVDGGARYQFTHLTLQEFFAAQALAAEPDKLLAHFTADRDAWREVVRLWCGLEHNSTGLIRQVYQVDPVLAFECLADAQQVDTAYVADLVRTFAGRLAEAAQDENLARAFALVAADPRGRGQALFDFVKGKLAFPAQRPAAATVLALTNLPRAAEALAKRAGQEPDLRPYLLRMGDLALPTLYAEARQGQTWALDGLTEVGTPQAALALVPLLWVDDAALPYQAAWRLAALLAQPPVEAALRAVPLTPQQRRSRQIDWIWEPFNEPPTSALPVIAGRIAYLLHTAPARTVLSGLPPACDPRLAIPLCAVAGQDGQLKKMEADARQKLIEEVDQSLPAPSGQAAIEAFVEERVGRVSTHPTWRHLFDSLSAPVQFNLLRCLIRNKPVPSEDDWRTVLRPSRYVFETSWQARGVQLLLALLGLLILWGLANNIMRQKLPLLSWQTSLAILGVMTIIGVVWGLRRSELRLNYVVFALFILALGVGPALAAIAWALSGDWLLSLAVGVVGVGGVAIAAAVVGTGGIAIGAGVSIVSGVVIGIVVGSVGAVIGSVVGGGIGIVGVIVGGAVATLGVAGGISTVVVRDTRNVSDIGGVIGGISAGILIGIVDSLMMYHPSSLLYGALGGLGIAIFWTIYLAVLAGLVWYGQRQERRAMNPLRGLLDEHEVVAAPPPRLMPLARWLRWYPR